MRFLLSLIFVWSAPLFGEALSSLAQDMAWQRILFYEDNSLVRGPHGLIDDPRFYLAENGKDDPLAELRATLAAFRKPQDPKEPNEHALCRFPARRLYLEQHAAEQMADLPQLSCPNFDTWWKDRRYESMSLVFSAFYPDNPASMFGHIFLRLHRPRTQQTSDLLDDSVNFAAYPDTENPILFNFKGAFGGFPGRFSLMPYYMKIQEYNNLESRDLWEYPLSADQEQIKRILLSLWEFGPHFANYFYFDDNCSYVMLMLMETGDARWDFTSHMRVWATPSSCLKAVVDQPGLVRSSHFRGSALSRYKERYDALNAEEKLRLQSIIQRRSSAQDERSVRVLDSVLEYIDFQEKLGGKENPVRFADLRDATLMQRVQHKEPPPAFHRMPEARDPRHAVPESWMMLSGAERDADALFRLSWQPVLHDLLGESRGYADDMQLQIMPMTFAFDPEAESVNLETLNVLHVISVQPFDRLVQPGSWSLQIGYRRDALCVGQEPANCPEGFVRYGRGLSFRLGGALLAGLMTAGVGGEHAVGQNDGFAELGPTLLIHGNLSSALVYAMQTQVARRWKEGDHADWYARGEAQLGLRVARLQQIRLQGSWEAAGEKDRRDLQLGILQYF